MHQKEDGGNSVPMQLKLGFHLYSGNILPMRKIQSTKNIPPYCKVETVNLKARCHFLLQWCVFTVKSDAEEFELYICQPFYLDSGKLIRGYNFVREVTDRYIADYPEITAAFEVQSSFNQN